MQSSTLMSRHLLYKAFENSISRRWRDAIYPCHLILAAFLQNLNNDQQISQLFSYERALNVGRSEHPMDTLYFHVLHTIDIIGPGFSISSTKGHTSNSKTDDTTGRAFVFLREMSRNEFMFFWDWKCTIEMY